MAFNVILLNKNTNEMNRITMRMLIANIIISKMNANSKIKESVGNINLGNNNSGNTKKIQKNRPTINPRIIYSFIIQIVYHL